MKKYLLMACCVALFAGCNKSGTGTYGTAEQSGSGSSPAPMKNSTPTAQAPASTPPGANTNVSSSAAADLGQQVPIPPVSTPNPGGTPGNTGTETATSSESALDKSLAGKVRSTLGSGEIGGISTLEAANVQVSADRGVITIRGSVASDQEKQAITDRLQKLDGVAFVKNELIVGGTTSQGNPPQNQTDQDQNKKD